MSDWAFIRRVLTVFAFAVLALAVWILSDLLLLVFAAILCAIALRALLVPLAQSTNMPEPLALLVVVVSISTLGAALALQFGTRLADQTEYLIEAAPAALQSLSQSFDLENVSRDVGGTAVGAIATGAMSIGSSVMAAAAGLILAVVGGVYLAAAPSSYRRGLVALFPERWHKVISATFDDSAFALSRWLKAQLIAMSVVGMLTGVGMWFVGVPSPLALALIAGITEFIPILGPIVGAIPALLLASTGGWEMSLGALAVAFAVQQIENNIIMPFIVGRVVKLPAAVGLFAAVAMGLLFGPLGFVLGYPLAIVADVAIRRLYVREALGRRVEIPAERERRAEAGEPPA